jgi:hypothetical protein
MKGTEVLNQWQNAMRHKKQYKKSQTQKNLRGIATGII